MKTFVPNLVILPAAQKTFWNMFQGVSELGFTLYGGTAIALRLGHRESVDFDFFSDQPLNRHQLFSKYPFLKEGQPYKDEPNSLCLTIQSPIPAEGSMKISFFGGINFGRVGEPELTSDNVMQVASLKDLMGLKLSVILKRIEAKDYKDIAAMLRAGESLLDGLSASCALYPNAFNPYISLQTLLYFEGGDLDSLSNEDKETLVSFVTPTVFNKVEKLEPLPILSQSLSTLQKLKTQEYCESDESLSYLLSQIDDDKLRNKILEKINSKAEDETIKQISVGRSNH